MAGVGIVPVREDDDGPVRQMRIPGLYVRSEKPVTACGDGEKHSNR
jgi:hypothetical protein